MSVIHKQFDLNGKNFNFCAIVTSDNKIYYRLKDFSDFLGYVCTTRSSNLIHEKFKFKWFQLSKQYYRHPDTIFVSEPGIHSLMFRSRIVESEQFNFVFDVVLPAFRETTHAREKLLERMLTETRETLAFREGTLMELQMSLVEKEKTLIEIQADLEKKDMMLRETRAALAEKDKMLVNEMQQTRQLQTDIQTVKSKVAVTPNSNSVRYTLSVYQYENTYKFIRAQKRCLTKARKRIPENFKLVYSVNNVPNPFHIVNRLKEMLPQCKVRYNTITSDANVIDLIKQCI